MMGMMGQGGGGMGGGGTDEAMGPGQIGPGGGADAAQVAQRYAALSPQEKQMLNQLFTPQLASILVKLLPELGPVLAPFIQGGAAGGGANPAAAVAPRPVVPQPIQGPAGGGMPMRPQGPSPINGVFARR